MASTAASNTSRKLCPEAREAFVVPLMDFQELRAGLGTENNPRRHPPRLDNSSLTFSQGMAELGSRSCSARRRSSSAR